MSHHNEEYKRKVYQKWISKDRPWYNIDKSKEPTAEEREIILEILQKENSVTPKTKMQYTVRDLAKALDY